jgi:hypothetical protein
MTRRSLLASGFVKETGSYRATIALDNLIAKGDMPVTIGIFVDPGVTATPNSDAQPRITEVWNPKNKRVWRVDANGNKSAVNGEVEYLNGVRFSSDQSLLYGTAGNSVFRRRLRRKGVVSRAPLNPSVPRL